MPPAIQWVVTTQTAPWQAQPDLTMQPLTSMPGVFVRLDMPQQTIQGFGACFNELGWDALNDLSAADRASIMHELFAPGVGANFTICRMPIGANDFSRDWYSYTETPGDFDLADFTIAHDHDTLIPFIKTALQYQPGLQLWASPWSPPTWMKHNQHYAAALPSPLQVGIDNGLRADQVGAEGSDMFIQDARYYAAYARYFGRFIDAYREQGIDIGMVMPQNEFNSPQVFPSCTWTPTGLSRFLAYLGPEMAARAVDGFIGTLERGNDALIDVSLRDPSVRRYIKGAGFQWAGKGAIAAIQRSHPQLVLYQTEQECGDGRNDWRYCRYAWSLLKHFLSHGTHAYQYWNIALRHGGISRWGWAQNSLVTVDQATRTFSYNHEYYLIKHVSHFVQPGAHRVTTMSYTGYENQLAFVNPDGSIVIVIHNDMHEPMPVGIMIGAQVINVTLPADSFSTIVVPKM